MGIRFRNSFSLLPGVRLNLGLSGTSIAIGPRGASINIGPKGAFFNLGIPGTGLSVRERLWQPQRTMETNLRSISGLERGDLENLFTQLRSAEGERQALAQQAVDRYQQLFELLRHVHRDTPAPNEPPSYEIDPFTTPAPHEPRLEAPTLGERYLPWLMKEKKAKDESALARYRAALREWEESKVAHQADQRQKKLDFEEGIRSSLPRALEIFSKEARAEQWAYPFVMDVHGNDDSTPWVFLAVDLPEIEDFPINRAELTSAAKVNGCRSP